MERSHKKDKFQLHLLPTEQEVAQYDPSRGECCTISRFRPDLRCNPRSPYNRSVARVFACGFNERFTRRDVKLLEEKFLDHLKNLQLLFRKGPEDNRKRRRASRKTTVSLLGNLTNVSYTYNCA